MAPNSRGASAGKVSARRAISAIASPELTPGAGWPVISIADKPFDDSGTICPAWLRTLQRSMSCGCMRASAVPWMITFLMRPW
ncbi:hypothetical protein G6F32_016440 [Rhizopus arrhizus]|nr:hypothetical protein G6F32_016440 [Rhizopus arrhizus]